MGRFFCEFWLFSLENRPKLADCAVNFDFFPTKILRNWPIFPRICPWKSREILLFFPRNIRSPEKIGNHLFVSIIKKKHLPFLWFNISKSNICNIFWGQTINTCTKKVCQSYSMSAPKKTQCDITWWPFKESIVSDSCLWAKYDQSWEIFILNKQKC